MDGDTESWKTRERCWKLEVSEAQLVSFEFVGGRERRGEAVEIECATKYKTNIGTREREREREIVLERLEFELILIHHLRRFCVGERGRDWVLGLSTSWLVFCGNDLNHRMFSFRPWKRE